MGGATHMPPKEYCEEYEWCDAGEIALLLGSELISWSEQVSQSILLGRIFGIQCSLMICHHWFVWGAIVSRRYRNVSTRNWLILVQGRERSDVAGGLDP